MNSARKQVKRRGSTTPRVEKNTSSKEIRVGKDPGRVKAFVRIRPFSKDEKSHRDGSMPFEVQEKQAQLKLVAAGHAEKTYAFDHVFTPEKTNDEVCKVMTPPLVKAAMNGFNGTLMAYGQTGAGKTYTLMSDNGIARSLIDTSFRQMQDDAKHNYKVTVSYLQIYQEKIFDLLNSNSGKSKGELLIRENPRTGIYVENLTEYVVRTPMEVLQFLAMGRKRLVFAETKMNMRSSRSHAVFQMGIERTSKEETNEKTIAEEDLVDKTDGTSQDVDVKNQEKSTSQDVDVKNQGILQLTLMTRWKKGTSQDVDVNNQEDDNYSVDLNTFGKDVIIRGKIHICDLAGSERIKRTGAAGERLSEAQHINSSLLELGNVIQALADEKTTHVPFRNSILTRLLQESLGGNCKTSLIICCSPSFRDVQETKTTLNFGLRAMKVTNTAYVNMEVDYKSLSDQLLKQLETKEDEIHKMKQACKTEIEKGCEMLTKELEQVRNDARMVEEKLKETHSHEILSLQDELYILRNEIEIKNGEMKKLEDSLCIIDDDVKRDKHLFVQYLKTQQTLQKQLKNVSLTQIIAILVDLISEAQQDYLTDQIVLESLTKLQTRLQDLSEDNRTTSNPDELEQNIIELIHAIEFDSMALNPDYLSENEVHMYRYKGFLISLLKQTQDHIQIIKLQKTFEKINTENQQLSKQVLLENSHQQTTDVALKRIEVEKHDLQTKIKTNDDVIENLQRRNAELTKQLQEQKLSLTGEIESVRQKLELMEISQRFDAVDGKTKKEKSIDIGVQVEENSIEENKMKGRRLIGTTIEDQERVVTEIETENVVENSDLRPSRDIFSGFGSTLGRIEGMMERKSTASKNHDSIASRFGLSSYLGSESLPQRSSSVLSSYKSDDTFKYTPYKSTYSSGLSDPFSTTTTRSESPFKTPSYTRSFSSLGDYDNYRAASPIHRTASPSHDRPCMACGTRQSEKNDERTRSLETKQKKMEERCVKLESELQTLQKEKEEFVNMFEDLTRIYPNDSRMRSLQNKQRIKPRRIDTTTQTFDEPRRGKDSIKVAHIKPFASGDSPLANSLKYATDDRSVDDRSPYSSPSKSINVSYGMNEDNFLHNVASTHYKPSDSFSPSSSSFSPTSPGYSYPSSGYSSNPGSPLARRKYESSTNRWASSPTNRWRDNDRNLPNLPISPEEEIKSPNRLIKSNLGYSSSVFSMLRDNDSAPSSNNKRKERPQTWYGAENKEIPYVYRSHLTKSKEELLSPTRELDIHPESNTEEVVFTSTRRSSWALPDWMKTKKRESSTKRDTMSNVIIQ